MNKMKFGAAVALAGALVGCATVDPLSVPQTERDLKEYKAEVARPIPTERYKIAIISKAIPHASDKFFDSFVAGEMESALANNFSNLGWFDTVDRKNGVALAGESMLVDGKAVDATSIPGAQYVLIAESQVSYVAKQGWKRTAIAMKARGAEIVSDLRLIDLSTKEPILVKKVRSVVTDVEKGNVKKAITQAANLNAKKLARIIASRFLPEVKVLQTRGDGQYAQVSMGKNYQATPAVKAWGWWPYKYLPLCYVKQTVVPAAKVDFFTLEKDGEKFDQSVFAHGDVILSDGKKAWVEVENYKNAGVFKGHSAKVSEEIDDGDAELE